MPDATPSIPFSPPAEGLHDTEVQAREYYAEDVTKFLTMGDGELTPDMVINHRRLPMAWAIAQKLKGSTHKCHCGQPLENKGRQYIHDYVLDRQLSVDVGNCPNGHTIYIPTPNQEVTNG